MNPEYPQPNEGEFKFGTKEEFLVEVEKIEKFLLPFLGEMLAKELAKLILELAKDVDDIVKELLKEPEVVNNFNYDGIHFNQKNGMGFTLAINGLGMLKGINENYLKSIFKFTTPPEPYPEIYKQDVDKLLDCISKDYINPVRGAKARYKRTGTVRNSLANFEIEEVLGNASQKEKEEAMKSILASQEDVRNFENFRKDDFFKFYDEQMRNFNPGDQEPHNE
ncbi:MAG: hypothetical protein WC794_03060 [Candidatus Doudnabacteria bacterium]